ncbi:MAG: ATP phosphoribosyltransferase, partial [Oligoflexia bacterium]|nr:ATP phosphoribosyltransferase [Oligoflexia bacterium]
MKDDKRLFIAMQKSGRLTDKTIELLNKCGLDLEPGKRELIFSSKKFPVDIMLVRDDDIPEYVYDGVCDLGVVGLNVLEETVLRQNGSMEPGIPVIRKLNYGYCRLSLAIPEKENYDGPQYFNNKSIATSYPKLLKKFLEQNKIKAKIIELKGSVEIAPALDIADCICDLVSTGSTLKANNLKEAVTILESQSVVIQCPKLDIKEKLDLVNRLLTRLDGVIKADQTKYIMMNANKNSLEKIKSLLPGMGNPSIMNLANSKDGIAIHAVCRENIFWETIE